MEKGFCVAFSFGSNEYRCTTSHFLNTLSKQYRQLEIFYREKCMKKKTERELITDCHGKTDINFTIILVFRNRVSSVERLEKVHELVRSLCFKMLPGALQMERRTGGWRETPGNELYLKKNSEGYHISNGSNYMIESSFQPYCKSKYQTHIVVLDMRTKQLLIEQFFPVPRCVRMTKMSKMSNRSYDF